MGQAKSVSRERTDRGQVYRAATGRYYDGRHMEPSVVAHIKHQTGTRALKRVLKDGTAHG